MTFVIFRDGGDSSFGNILEIWIQLIWNLYTKYFIILFLMETYRNLIEKGKKYLERLDCGSFGTIFHSVLDSFTLN